MGEADEAPPSETPRSEMLRVLAGERPALLLPWRPLVDALPCTKPNKELATLSALLLFRCLCLLGLLLRRVP